MQTASCVVCHAKPSTNSPWKIELAELNEAIRSSCDDEQVWDTADQVVNETESLNLIADRERVFLVGIQRKSDRPESDTFTGATSTHTMLDSIGLSCLLIHQVSSYTLVPSRIRPRMSMQ
jgi:hypothetical protein